MVVHMLYKPVTSLSVFVCQFSACTLVYFSTDHTEYMFNRAQPEIYRKAVLSCAKYSLLAISHFSLSLLLV